MRGRQTENTKDKESTVTLEISDSGREVIWGGGGRK
jgi:hypothetical protein